MSGSIAIGVVADEDVQRLRATLDNLRAFTPLPYELWLLGDGPGPETLALFETFAPARQSTTAEPRGMAACLNRLARQSDAGTLVLLEAGSLVSPDWLERLLRGIAAHPRNGLAGPSTNRSWNEQQVFTTSGDLAARARQAAAHYVGVVRTLEPLYSLADFCYMVRREVIEVIGPADEAYGLGPCWEMDYNIRAARDGWRGVWVGDAYVERMPFSLRRQREERRLFERNKRLYQSKFCGRQLSGTGGFFRSHCRGDDCPNFAPRRDKPEIAVTQIKGRERPAVTCLMPTYNRREWLGRSIGCFLAQDFADAELLILDDGSDSVADLIPDNQRIRYHRLNQRHNLGAKRNLGCELARGDLIAHWDDDDWYPPWRLAQQIGELNESGDDVCGSSQLYFLDGPSRLAYHYVYDGPLRPCVAGSTFVYRKSYWQRHAFREISKGEDVHFLSDVPDRRVRDMEDPRLCVAAIHSANTSHKLTGGDYWRQVPLTDIERLVLDSAPLVSCTMPTYNRRAFLPLTLAAFDGQDYPNREIIVVDDGTDSVEDIVAGHPGVRYLRLPHRTTIGEKRNLACGVAKGRIIAHWDDDDWYAPDRLSLQIAPLLAGRADMTGFENLHLLELDGGQFWMVTAELHRRMFVGGVHGGSLVFWRQIYEEGIRYPEVNLAEDAMLISRSLERGKRLKPVWNHGSFVYVRHGGNTWQFQEGTFLDPQGWIEDARPLAFPASLVGRYRAAAFVG